MTNEVSVEEAIDVFKIMKRQVLEDSREDKVLDIAIKALETASCIKEKCAYCPHCEHCDVDDETLAIKALEQQPITWIVGKDNCQVAVRNMPIDKMQRICAIIGEEERAGSEG